MNERGTVENPMRELEKELGTPPPAALGELRDDDVRRLAEAVRQARRQQAKELGAAADRALGHIPRLLRGPIRKVMGG